MINTKKLDAVIKKSGMYIKAIAEALGMSATTFKSKRCGDADWKSSEIMAFKKLFRLSLIDIGEIFFASESDLESQESCDGN